MLRRMQRRRHIPDGIAPKRELPIKKDCLTVPHDPVVPVQVPVAQAQLASRQRSRSTGNIVKEISADADPVVEHRIGLDAPTDDGRLPPAKRIEKLSTS